jgi:hypothetical protein
MRGTMLQNTPYNVFLALNPAEGWKLPGLNYMQYNLNSQLAFLQ